MVEKRDKLGRRKRLVPVSTGKRIRLTERDLFWLKCLATHGPLASSFLLEFAEGLGVNKKRAQERLTDLFNEDNTVHGGAYLTRPPQQFSTLDSRYNQLVYDLTDAGEKALKSNGTRRRTHGGPWWHKFMVSSITASVELAILQRSDLKFIPQSEILKRANSELGTKVQLPTLNKSIKLIPDSLFGIEYLSDAGSRFRFFAVEADRSTEPLTSKNLNRKSALRSLEAYQEYIGKQHYQQHLNLTAPLLVLNVFYEQARADKVRLLYERKIPGGLSYQLFQYWPEFAPPYRPPRPNTKLLTGPWRRVGKCPVSIDKR